MFKYSSRLMTALLLSAGVTGLAFAGNTGPAPMAPSLVPGNPEAGECYARVKVPAQYSTQGENVMVEEGYETLEVSQAELATRSEKIMTKEASVRYQVRQPTYKTITDQVVVRPAYEKLTVTPPKFSNVTETIKVSNSRLVWKHGNPAELKAQGYIIHSTADGGAGGRGYRSTTEYGRARTERSLCGAKCEIWCLVEEPGETVSYNRKVLSQPADVRRVPVPAKYRSVMKQVVSDPGGVQEIPVPAQYQTIMVEDIVRQSGVRPVNNPPVFGSVAKKVMTSPERYEWRRVVCKPGTHPGDRVQRSPRSGGSSYYSNASSSGSSSSQSYSNGYNGAGSRTYGHATSQTQSQPASAYATGTYAAPKVHSSSPHTSRIHTSTARTSHSNVVPRSTIVGGQPHYYGSDLPVSGQGSLTTGTHAPQRSKSSTHRPAGAKRIKRRWD